MKQLHEFTPVVENSEDDIFASLDEYSDNRTNNIDFEDVDKSFIVLEHLINTVEILKNKSQVSQDDLALVRICKEMAVIGTTSSIDQLLPSMESWSDSKISVESVSDDIKTSIKKIIKYIGYIYKNELDRIEMGYRYFELQSLVLARVKKQIEASDKTSFTIRVKNSKYLRYDDNVIVKDIATYIHKLEEVSEFCITYNSAGAELMHGDLLKSWKNLASVFLMPLLYDKVYMEYFNLLKNFVERVSSISSFNIVEHDSDIQILESPVYLGMSRCELSMPLHNTYSMGSVDSCRKVHKHFNINFLREEKLEITPLNETITFENVTKKELLKILSITDNIIKSYRKHLHPIVRISKYSNIIVISDAVWTAVIPFQWWKALLSNYRIMVRLSLIAFGMMDTSVIYSRGIAAKALQLVRVAK